MSLTRADFKTLVASAIIICIGVISLLARLGEKCVPRLYLICSAALIFGGAIFIIATLLAIHTRYKEMKRQADEFLARLEAKCDKCRNKDICNVSGHYCGILHDDDE